MDAEGTLTDGTRTIKLYTMTGFDHTDDMLLVYLSKEKILAEADAYSPPETPTTPLATLDEVGRQSGRIAAAER